MRKTLLLALAILPLIASAQKLKEYTASNGITYHVGDTVKVGMGSMPNGDFRYIQMGGIGAALFVPQHKNYNSDDLNAKKNFSGTNVIIKKIKQYEQHAGAVKVVFVTKGGGLTTFDIYIEEAIASCEIGDCNNQPVTTTVIQPTDDKFDQLKKLKALLDAGAITQAEYDEQKKKLLNQ